MNLCHSILQLIKNDPKSATLGGPYITRFFFGYGGNESFDYYIYIYIYICKVHVCPKHFIYFLNVFLTERNSPKSIHLDHITPLRK